MTEQEKRYWISALKGDSLIGDFLRGQSLHGIDPLKKSMSQPVCGRCEKMAFHHKSGIICPSCGYEGPKTHNLKIHIKEGHYK